MAINLSLYSNTSYVDALSMSQTDVLDFFESSAFDSFRKTENAKISLQSAIVDRLNEVIKGLNNLSRRR